MSEPERIGFLSAFEPRINIRSTIAQTLQAAVVAGQLEPGQVYSAPKLAAQFGVSATPVREAMLDLVSDGLVDVVPNRGFRVRVLSENELDELCEIRLLLEVPMVGRICSARLRAADAAHLHALARATEVAADAGDLVAHSRADLEFHLELLRLGENRTLVEMVRNLRNRSRLYGPALRVNKDQLRSSSAEHQLLVDMAARRERSAAEELMRKHIGDVRKLWASAAHSTPLQPSEGGGGSADR